MLTSKEIEKCIEVLISVNSTTGNQELLEVIYTLQKELSTVSLTEQLSNEINRARSNGSIDIEKLLRDNIQLFNEKEKALKQNKKLKDVIEGKLPVLDSKLHIIANDITEVKRKIDNLWQRKRY